MVKLTHATTHTTAVLRTSDGTYPWYWRCSCGVSVGCFVTEAKAAQDANDHIAWQRRGEQSGASRKQLAA